jgi:hypothetical protein
MAEVCAAARGRKRGGNHEDDNGNDDGFQRTVFWKWCSRRAASRAGAAPAAAGEKEAPVAVFAEAQLRGAAAAVAPR